MKLTHEFSENQNPSGGCLLPYLVHQRNDGCAIAVLWEDLQPNEIVHEGGVVLVGKVDHGGNHIVLAKKEEINYIFILCNCKATSPPNTWATM